MAQIDTDVYTCILPAFAGRGRTWRMDESRLSGPNGETLNRLPAHRAFWFGWHAAFPDTRLVK